MKENAASVLAVMVCGAVFAAAGVSVAAADNEVDVGFCELTEELDPAVDAAMICDDWWCQDRCEARGCLAGVCIPQGACRCYIC